MDMNEYQQYAARTATSDLGVRDLHLNWALGLCGEAGEYANLVKKRTFHGHPQDDASLLDELGDVLWYVAVAVAELGYSLEDVALHNLDKLRARYPEGFSQEASRNRDGG